MKNRSYFIVFIAIYLWSGGAFAQVETLGSKDFAGMHLSNGIRAQGKQYVLYSRMNANAMNPNGFITNDFIPYCVLTYQVNKVGSDWHTKLRSPMRLTVKGPEYGVSNRLDGPGKYQWKVEYLSPYYGGFYRHTDKATGVAPWWKPFALSYTFVVAKDGSIEEENS